LGDEPGGEGLQDHIPGGLALSDLESDVVFALCVAPSLTNHAKIIKPTTVNTELT
jgi:hypothetical protein